VLCTTLVMQAARISETSVHT